jgi:hypothetical protein
MWATKFHTHIKNGQNYSSVYLNLYIFGQTDRNVQEIYQKIRSLVCILWGCLCSICSNTVRNVSITSFPFLPLLALQPTMGFLAFSVIFFHSALSLLSFLHPPIPIVWKCLHYLPLANTKLRNTFEPPPLRFTQVMHFSTGSTFYCVPQPGSCIAQKACHVPGTW